MTKQKMHLLPQRWVKTAAWSLVAVGVLCSKVALAEEAAHIDMPGWYGTVAGGVKLGHGSSATQVEEGVAGVPLVLTGRTTWGNGSNFSVAIGRQMRWDNEEPSANARLWRLEGEYWAGRIERKSFNVAALNAELGDTMKTEALFLNALLHVASTEQSRWWLGGGIGHGNVRLPDASTGPLRCVCLGTASGSGTAYRLKAQAERLLSDQSALFIELGYVKLPSLSSNAAGFPRTHYDGFDVTHLSVGWRKQF